MLVEAGSDLAHKDRSGEADWCGLSCCVPVLAKPLTARDGTRACVAWVAGMARRC